MVEVDFDKIIEYSNELKKYNGFLPLLVRAIIMQQWTKNLLKYGTYDEIIKECVDTKPRTYEGAVKELVNWIKNNPDYKDMIK